MPKYYRVNLKDKENNIIYPNIHNLISVDNKTGAITSPGGFIGLASKASADSDGNKINITYLKLSGGTMTGDITFADVTSTIYPADSKKIKFSGSTDAAEIYYRVTASDAGELVLNLRDDSNARLVFAYNGTTKSYIDTNGNFSGKAASATKLATARTITIGSTGKSVDGSANISWTLAEIGAAASSHTHSYLPLSGGTMTGALNFSGDNSRNLTWNDGTHWQRIHTVDDSTNNTSVFEFQQTTNSGSSWTTLATIRDNGYFFTGGLIQANGARIISNNASGGDATLELLRGKNADWRIINTGGNLHFQTNWTDSKQSSYYTVACLYHNENRLWVKTRINVEGGRVTFSGDASVRNFFATTIGTWNSNYSKYLNGTIAFCW